MAEEGTALRQRICEVVKTQRGVVFSQPAMVHRPMYSGRGIIAPNKQFSPNLVDRRGYLPVEWWIMSKTEARNATPIKNEGITVLKVGDQHVLMTEALKVAEEELMGRYASLWPLTKVLDIGGTARTPKYQNENVDITESVKEVPPIPCHVHPGGVVEGRCGGHGKTEAYFFPPLDVPPYNLELGAVKTRLGLKPGTTKDQVLRSLKQFGKSDDLYQLLEEYPVRPWESWTIEEKIIHAPGPWLTFEIQLPQDDFNLLAWILGEQIPTAELDKSKDDYQLRGLGSEEQLFRETLNWEDNIDPNFQNRWWRRCEVLAEGNWGRAVRLFYHIFYGEGFVIKPGCTYQREADERPFAGIVWSGSGHINDLMVDCVEQECKEFLVTPNNAVEFKNSSESSELIVFTVFPLKQPPQCNKANL